MKLQSINLLIPPFRIHIQFVVKSSIRQIIDTQLLARHIISFTIDDNPHRPPPEIYMSAKYIKIEAMKKRKSQLFDFELVVVTSTLRIVGVHR
jgi:hypothetical protein